MTIKRRGFTLENSGDNPFGIATSGSDQPPSDTERIVEFINRLLANYGQQQVPPGLTGGDLLNELDRIVSTVESTAVTPMAKAAMNNRNRRAVATRVPTDAEIAARLRAKGIDPKFMPQEV